VLEDLGLDDVTQRAVHVALRAFCMRTWGKPACKVGDAHLVIAREMASSLTGEVRHWFEVGTGVLPGAGEACRAALFRNPSKAALLDARPYLASLACRVRLFHGLDDDVISHEELDRLLAAMPAHVDARGYKTGLFHHTGGTGEVAGDVDGLVHKARATARELATMVRMLRVLAESGRF
jgi:pimeloyl-ACP methyl ester carboxylesterase